MEILKAFKVMTNQKASINNHREFQRAQRNLLENLERKPKEIKALEILARHKGQLVQTKSFNLGEEVEKVIITDPEDYNKEAEIGRFYPCKEKPKGYRYALCSDTIYISQNVKELNAGNSELHNQSINALKTFICNHFMNGVHQIMLQDVPQNYEIFEQLSKFGHVTYILNRHEIKTNRSFGTISITNPLILKPNEPEKPNNNREIKPIIIPEIGYVMNRGFLKEESPGAGVYHSSGINLPSGREDKKYSYSLNNYATWCTDRYNTLLQQANRAKRLEELQNLGYQALEIGDSNPRANGVTSTNISEKLGCIPMIIDPTNDPKKELEQNSNKLHKFGYRIVVPKKATFPFKAANIPVGDIRNWVVDAATVPKNENWEIKVLDNQKDGAYIHSDHRTVKLQKKSLDFKITNLFDYLKSEKETKPGITATLAVCLPLIGSIINKKF